MQQLLVCWHLLKEHWILLPMVAKQPAGQCVNGTVVQLLADVAYVQVPNTLRPYRHR
jgi:hypothetical protein